jgi:hypothetical protein
MNGTIGIDSVEETPSGKLSRGLRATCIVVREPATDCMTRRRATAPQKCDQTGGGVSITVSGAETRHIGVGEIVLEDTTGKWHITNHTVTNPATRSPDRQASAIAFNYRMQQGVGRGLCDRL